MGPAAAVLPEGDATFPAMGEALRRHALLEIGMTTFDDREKGFEKKFALDQDLKFRAEARRNKLLAEWAAEKLGIAGEAVEEYVKAVRKADLAEKGDEDVVRKVKQDFADRGIALDETELRKVMGEFLAKAVAEVEAASK